MHRFIVPDVIQAHPVQTLKPTANVLEAARKMKRSNIAAILVTDDNDRLIGIVTERDLTRRVIAEEKSPEKTRLADVMTPDPSTLSPDDSAGDALEMMRERSFRHIPVCEGNKIIGMVSIRDLYAAVKADLEEDIRETEAFVFGDRYSA